MVTPTTSPHAPIEATLPTTLDDGLADELLADWSSGVAAFDALDDGLRRVAVHLELLRPHLGGDRAVIAAHRVDLIERAVLSLRTLVQRLEWLEELRDESAPAERVALDQVVDSVLASLSSELVEAGAVVTVDDDLGSVVATPVDVATILTELVSNSLRHRGASDLAVRISALPADPDSLAVSVTDTGPGFAEDYLECVFSAGVVLLQDGVRPGAGVGLAAARLLATRNNGTISARSEPGRGSTFTVTLPATRPATSA